MYRKSAIAAVIAAFCLLGGVAVSGYILYGVDVTSNVLVSLPASTTALLAQGSILPVVIGVYPLILYPLTMTLQDFCRKPAAQDLPANQKMLLEKEESNRSGSVGMFAIQLLMVILTGFVAATGIDLGPVNNWAGIFSLAQTVVMPAALWYRMLQLDGKSSTLLFLHVGIGGALWLMTLFWTGNHLESISHHCSWWTHSH